MNRIIILVMVVLSIGVSCAKKEEDSEDKSVDFSLAPELAGPPTLDKSSIVAGDSINTFLELDRQVNWASVSFRNSEDIINGSTFRPTNDNNSYQEETFISCSSKQGVYYPYITLYSENGDTSYDPDSSTDPQYYVMTKRIIDSSGNTKTEIETTTFLVPAIEITQSNPNEESDLRVNIENITKNESTLSIDFAVSNLSGKRESLFTIDFWQNLDTAPSEDDVPNLPFIDGVFHFGTEYCINANETIHSSIVVRKNENSGVAYAIIDRFDPQKGYYVMEHISDGVAW